MSHFFGEGVENMLTASKQETETFLDLLHTREDLALDYINSWMLMRNYKILPEQSLITMPFFATMKRPKIKKRS